MFSMKHYFAKTWQESIEDFVFFLFWTVFVNNSYLITIYRKTIKILIKNIITQDDTLYLIFKILIFFFLKIELSNRKIVLVQQDSNSEPLLLDADSLRLTHYKIEFTTLVWWLHLTQPTEQQWHNFSDSVSY